MALVLVLGTITTACVRLHEPTPNNTDLLMRFRQADTSDRRALADGVITALRKQIGMHAPELTRQIGYPDVSGNGVGIGQSDDVKYTVYHKGSGWEYFPVSIRDWKVVWIGDVESVIQM